ncbi:hypothetical protein [Pseudopedobacter saltans]|uniref:hypothetical protein n=1 Tax=Pseudopedobacter saltans TaxID=151895 RepID=UPI0011D2B635|nr:hypothetical protein [Pseudopedobacter saltans]
MGIVFCSCASKKSHFEWIKAADFPRPVTQNESSIQIQNPKQVELVVYLKEKQHNIYNANSDSFFLAHGILDTVKSKSHSKNYKGYDKGEQIYIYNDSDIEEARLNSALKQFEKNIVTKDNQSLEIDTDKEEVSVTGEQNLFDGLTEQFLFLGSIGLLVLSLFVWMFFNRKSKKNTN